MEYLFPLLFVHQTSYPFSAKIYGKVYYLLLLINQDHELSNNPC